MPNRIAFLCLLLTILFSSSANAVQATLNENSRFFLPDHALWQPVTALSTGDINTLTRAYNADEVRKSSVLHTSGAYLAKVPLVHTGKDTAIWYIRPNASFVDTGLAFWESPDGQITPVANFSQSFDDHSPSFMYSQVFNLTLAPQATGVLWLYVEAQYYPNPLSITFYSPPLFYSDQFTVNTITVASVTVMLTLGLIAFIIFIRLRNAITLACAGYLGLHGIGWAALGGLMTDSPLQSFGNTTYLGYYLFPFAIACASWFSSLLFNCAQDHFRLARYFSTLTTCCLAIGVIAPFLSFTIIFVANHIIAGVWLITSVAVGCTFYWRYVRARFYLLGNLLYSISLALFILTHLQTTPLVTHPELIAVMALAADCFCIMLTLADWLYLRQKEFNRSFHLARIDPLTQLGNRYALDEAFARLKSPFVLVFIDFDGLKAINDQRGHEEGDRYLTTGAKLMHQYMAAHGQLFRTGGDEFVWLFEAKPSHIAFLLQQIPLWVSECEQALRLSGWHASGMSYGIATSLETDNKSNCLALADQRMYLQKKQKKAPPMHTQPV